MLHPILETLEKGYVHRLSAIIEFIEFLRIFRNKARNKTSPYSKQTQLLYNVFISFENKQLNKYCL